MKEASKGVLGGLNHRIRVVCGKNQGSKHGSSEVGYGCSSVREAKA